MSTRSSCGGMRYSAPVSVTTAISSTETMRIRSGPPSFHAKKPSALIAHTVKGKGVSFAEDTYVWHSNTVNDELYARALAELGAR